MPNKFVLFINKVISNELKFYIRKKVRDKIPGILYCMRVKKDKRKAKKQESEKSACNNNQVFVEVSKQSVAVFVLNKIRS